MSRSGIGILGGGQLARMMALEAHRLGLKVHVLSPLRSDPAAQVVSGDSWIQGDPNELEDLKRLMVKTEVVTFESEFYNAETIEIASRATHTPVHPSPRLMGVIQDRLTQKELLDRYEISTAPWRSVSSADDAVVAYTAFHGKVVFKKRRFGYDGYGTSIVRNEGDLSAFLNTMQSGDATYIAEALIKFRRELAMVAVRDVSGKTQFYPVVESKQSDSKCLWVKGPIAATGGLRDLQESFRALLQNENYVGAIGIELFESLKTTRSGKTLYSVNELAPRVHNTGHYTQNAFNISQFAAHLQCVNGSRLGSLCPVSRGFAMWNLIGIDLPSESSQSLSPSANSGWLHWYGKSEARAGRKMGHVNTVAKNPEDALKLAKSFAVSLQPNKNRTKGNS